MREGRMVVVEDVEWSEEGVEVCGCVGLGRSLFSFHSTFQHSVSCVRVCACARVPSAPHTQMASALAARVQGLSLTAVS